MRKWSALCLGLCCFGAVMANDVPIPEQATTLHDPTKPPFFQGVGSTAQNTLGLSMILTSGNTRFALISDDFVKEGDTIDGYSVVKINQNGVVLAGKNGKRVLHWAPSVKKQMTSGRSTTK